jgi:hypothetical protein
LAPLCCGLPPVRASLTCMRKTPKKTGSGKKSVRRVKSRRSAHGGPTPAGGSSKNSDPGVAEFASWITEQLTLADSLAWDYHEDFLKSRKKDPLKAGVRARIRTKLDNYAKRLENLSTAFAALPERLRLYLAALEATPGAPSLRSMVPLMVHLLGQMRTAIESARSQLAAPLSEQEEREFYRTIELIGVSLESLREVITGMFTLITAERLTATDPGEEFARDPDELEEILRRLENDFATFGRAIRGQSPTAPPSPAEYLDAVSYYQKRVGKARAEVDKLFPVLPESVCLAAARTGEEPLAARVGTLRAKLDIHMYFLCTALAAREACRTNLPREADVAAQQIRAAIADLGLTAARIDLSRGDETARCDTVPEAQLRDYTRLGATDKKHEQFRVIVDVLLMLYDSHGPAATMDRKQIEHDVRKLARHRKVTGLGTTNLWTKLDWLVGEHIVRKCKGEKTELTPNAADKYRLSFPAQRKFSCHAADVRAEFEEIED